MRKMLSNKIHRATVTHADVDYEGSITLPPQLLEAARLVPYQAVSIWNVTNGHRFETYTILGTTAHEIAINAPGLAVYLRGYRVISSSSARSATCPKKSSTATRHSWCSSTPKTRSAKSAPNRQARSGTNPARPPTVKAARAMLFDYQPLLQVQRDLYAMPCGMARFREYLRTMIDSTKQDLKLPLVAMNPMGQEHLPMSLGIIFANGCRSNRRRGDGESGRTVATPRASTKCASSSVMI